MNNWRYVYIIFDFKLAKDPNEKYALHLKKN